MRPLHAGRTFRHARHRETGNGRALFEHPVNQVGRYVSFDDIAVNDSGVAALECA